MQWYTELTENVGNVPKIFVGNKTDLREEYQMEKQTPKDQLIRKESARRIIEEEFQCKYMECSALTPDGLKAIFDEAMRIVLQKKLKPMMMMKKKQQESSGLCNLI
jgi:GTPase SAR1 family protein